MNELVFQVAFNKIGINWCAVELNGDPDNPFLLPLQTACASIFFYQKQQQLYLVLSSCRLGFEIQGVNLIKVIFLLFINHHILDDLAVSATLINIFLFSFLGIKRSQFVSKRKRERYRVSRHRWIYQSSFTFTWIGHFGLIKR